MTNKIAEPIDERSENEKWYDDEIAPVLATLGKQCNERGVRLIACVDYDYDCFGITRAMLDSSAKISVKMAMAYFGMTAKGNLDSFYINFMRWCNENGINTEASVVVRMMNRKYD